MGVNSVVKRKDDIAVILPDVLLDIVVVKDPIRPLRIHVLELPDIILDVLVEVMLGFVCLKQVVLDPGMERYVGQQGIIVTADLFPGAQLQ